MKKVIIIFLFIISAAISKAQNNSTDEKQAVIMLKTFYTAYMSEFSDNNIKHLEIQLSQLRKNYCTIKCEKEYKKLVDETDSDPIIKAQDSDAKWTKTLSVVRDPKNQNLYIVSYNNDEYGEDGKLHKQTTTSKLIVIKQNSSFKIDSIL